ncbi:LSU ribosomal protein L18p [Cutibacterium acnes JCM 18918]|nr:LSU ribosomal protein L18p [Cutibacterium acnes JCM 18918]
MASTLTVRKSLSDRAKARARRQARGRKKIFGTVERPRMVVTRSSKHVFVQVIDDVAGNTLVSASTMEPSCARCPETRPRRRPASAPSLVSAPSCWHYQGRVRQGRKPVPRADRRAGRCGPRGRSRLLTHERQVSNDEWNPAPRWRCRW